MKNMLLDLYYRDIDKLKEEMSAYTDQKVMWSVAPGISNSGGNLCLHLIGNLEHQLRHRFAGKWQLTATHLVKRNAQ